MIDETLDKWIEEISSLLIPIIVKLLKDEESDLIITTSMGKKFLIKRIAEG